MADENTLRSYRANDPYGHDAVPSGERDHAGGHDHAGHDPLAELARLIGQNDPFADIGRGSPRAGEGRDPSHFAVGAPPSAPDWRRNPAPSYDAPVQPGYEADYQPDLRPPHFPPSTVPRHAPMPAASAAGLPADPYGDPHDQVAVQDRPYGDEDRFDHAHAGAPYAAGDSDHDPYYEDEVPMGPQDEEMYDDAPNARRRGGLLTVVTLVGCAMLGTAGAYAYRTYYVGAVPANPPVIVADKTPAKVVPPTDAQSSKTIQDRVGNQGGSERVVSHEEQPVELKPPGTQSSPRVVLPAPVAPMPNTGVAFPPPPAAMPAPAAATPGPTPRSAPGNEPKRIRTVTIRPDGTDLTGKPVGGIGPSGSSPAPRAAAAQSRGGPLSLTPGAETPPPAATSARSAPATRLAAAPSSGGSGGYMVQISSQRSEAEAHASFRAMQAKYQSVLGGHEGTVRRADLGAKGTFYRALVGPFASAGEAGHLCSQLKAAGGQCIIQRN